MKECSVTMASPIRHHPHMRNSPLVSFSVLLLSPALLAGCVSAEARLRTELDAANRCETVEDCTLIGSKCPFDCNVYVHRDEAERLKTALEAFPSTCEYACIQTYGVECASGKCKAVTQPPLEPGTKHLGDACQADVECLLPDVYAIRSSCPFNARCVDSACAAVCPMTNEATRDWTRPAVCDADADCDCGAFAGGEKQRCGCVGGQCFAIMDNTDEQPPR